MSHLPEPPKLVEKLFQWFCPEAIYDEVEGDLYEWFLRDYQNLGKRKASIRYLRNVAGYLRPPILKYYRPRKTPQIQYFMNFLKPAWRNLIAYRKVTYLNIVGLTIGL